MRCALFGLLDRTNPYPQSKEAKTVLTLLFEQKQHNENLKHVNQFKTPLSQTFTLKLTRINYAVHHNTAFESCH